MPLISVIIPVYNVEKYLRKCLDSILAQTHKNWEAILVDDGSPDNCGSICDEYAAKDKRFKVIHQPNGGVSVARQTGLDNSRGEYVIHCDPDDWIEPNMLEEMSNCATENNADMVICNFIVEEAGRTEYIVQDLQNPTTAKYVQQKIINQQLHGSCWNKLIRRDLIRTIAFHPKDISICEDELFNIRVLCNDIKVIYLPGFFYHYNINNTSIYQSPNLKAILSRKIVISECEKIVRKENFNNLYAMKKSLITSLFLSKHFNELKNTYKEIHQEIIESHRKYNFFNPLAFFVARAIKGSPERSYKLYQINMRILYFIQKLRRRI